MTVNGAVVRTGGFTIDDQGNITLTGSPSWTNGGLSASITNLSGNVDPEIIFGVGATNNSNATAFYSFAFSLPLGGLPVPLDTYADLGISLSSPSAGAAFVFPTSGVGLIVDSQDIRLSPFQSTDKGVDVGTAHTGTAGMTVTFAPEVAMGSILSGGPYDLMSVIVSFGLTDPDSTSAAGSGVGMSGVVRQTPVPEPTAFLLLGGAGLLGLALLGRRRGA